MMATVKDALRYPPNRMMAIIKDALRAEVDAGCQKNWLRSWDKRSYTSHVYIL